MNWGEFIAFMFIPDLIELITKQMGNLQGQLNIDLYMRKNGERRRRKFAFIAILTTFFFFFTEMFLIYLV